MRKIILYAVAVIFVGLFECPMALATTIGITPSSPFAVTMGNNYTADVVVSDLAGQAVSAFDINVLYDAALLNAWNVSFDSVSLMGGIDNTFWDGKLFSGNVNAAAVSLISDVELLALQSGLTQLTLFQIGFTAMTDGTANLVFEWGPGKDVKGLENQIIVDSSPAPVPEPSTFLLLGAGLAGVGFIRRRAKK